MIRSQFRAYLLLSLSALIVACSGSGNGVNPTVSTTTPVATPATLQSIAVTPSASSSAAGTTTQLSAMGTYSDGSKTDLTNQVAWTSSNSAIANVASDGKLSAFAPGSATVLAALDGVSGSTTFTVTAPVLTSIEITPPMPSLANGRTLQLTATGIFSDNSTQNLTTQITWASSTGSVASIGGATGIATALGVGTTTLSATNGLVTGNTTLTVTAAALVSIQVTPASPSVAKGLTVQLTATGVFSDNSTQNLTSQVTWKSSNGGVATIPAAGGLASAAGVGGATMSATIGTISGNTALTVTPAILETIQVTPPAPSYAKGVTAPLTATGIFSDNSNQDLTTQATWASSNTSIATVSNTTGTIGVVKATGIGTSTVTASVGSISGSTVVTGTPATLVSIQVTPATPSIAKGLTQQFTATGIYTDSTTQNLTTTATWSSSATVVSTVSNAAGTQGTAFAATVGSTTITSTLGLISGNTIFSVTPATVVSIQTTPTNPSVAKGVAQPFTATGTFTDNSTQNVTIFATWASSTGTVASISNAAGSNGVASTGGPGSTIGTTMISASIGSVSGSTVLTVTPATLVTIQVTQPTPTVAKGLTQQFTATGIYTDNSTQDLTLAGMTTWASATTSVATISNGVNKGLATTVAQGTSVISAISGGITGSTTINVTSASLQSITVAPALPSVAKGLTRQFAATGNYSDNSTQDLTLTAMWSSATTTVASISNAAGSNGLATTRVPGSTTGTTIISASSGGVSGSTTLTVTAATLLSIAVTPTPSSVAIGLTKTFVATGTYTDLSTQPLTALATWASSDTTALTNPDASGVATAQGTADATVTVTASVGSIVSNDATVSVFASYTQGTATTAVYKILSSCGGASGCHTPTAMVWTYTSGDSDTTYASLSGSVPKVIAASNPTTNLHGQACVITPPATAPPMPLPPNTTPVYATLSASECAIILQWITDGAPKN